MTSVVSLTKRDIDYIGRVVATEVDHRLARTNPDEYARSVAAVTDTILNRVASDQFPNTTQGVVDQRRQFSKITGPKNLAPYGSVARTPKARPAVQALVEQHIAARVAGVPSVIGGHVNYANPAHSSPSNVTGWINPMIQNDDSTWIGGHVHGTNKKDGFRTFEGVPLTDQATFVGTQSEPGIGTDNARRGARAADAIDRAIEAATQTLTRRQAELGKPMGMAFNLAPDLSLASAPANARPITTARQPADLFDRIASANLRPPADVPNVPQDSLSRAYDGRMMRPDAQAAIDRVSAPLTAPVGTVERRDLAPISPATAKLRAIIGPPNAAQSAIDNAARPQGLPRLTDPTGGQLRFGAVTGIPSEGFGPPLGTPGAAASVMGGSSGDPLRDEMNARRENARVQEMARRVAPQVQSAVSGIAEALRPSTPAPAASAGITSAPLRTARASSPPRNFASPATQKLRAIVGPPAGSAAGAAMGSFGNTAAAPAVASQTNRTGNAAARGGLTQAVRDIAPGGVTASAQRLANSVQNKTIEGLKPNPNYSVPRHASMGAAMGSFGAPPPSATAQLAAAYGQYQSAAPSTAKALQQAQAATIKTPKAAVPAQPMRLSDLTQSPMEPGAQTLGNVKPQGITASDRIKAALTGAALGGTVAGTPGALVGAAIGAATGGQMPSLASLTNRGGPGTQYSGGVYRDSNNNVRGGNFGGGVTGYTPAGNQLQGGGGIGSWSR